MIGVTSLLRMPRRPSAVEPTPGRGARQIRQRHRPRSVQGYGGRRGVLGQRQQGRIGEGDDHAGTVQAMEGPYQPD